MQISSPVGDDVLCTLLVYRFPTANRSGASSASRIVLGRPRPDRPADEPGFASRTGVVRITRGVLLLPRDTAEELADRLRALGAAVTAVPIRISSTDLKTLGDTAPTGETTHSATWKQGRLAGEELKGRAESTVG